MPSNEFDREKLAFEQNSEHFRSLNQMMWQVPVIAMTLTGGLWFGAANVGEVPGFQYLLLALAAIANVGLIFVLSRLRYVMGEYLRTLRDFAPNAFVSANGRWLHAESVVATTFRVLLAASACISLLGMYFVHHAGLSSAEGRQVIEVVNVPK